MASDRAAGLAATARALAEGDVSSRVLVEEALARIEATQPALNAFRTVRGEAALAEADAADRERAARGRRPPLGVHYALTVKDDVTPPPRKRGGFPLCQDGFATDQPGP